jgi:hypothetical protein
MQAVKLISRQRKSTSSHEILQDNKMKRMREYSRREKDAEKNSQKLNLQPEAKIN